MDLLLAYAIRSPFESDARGVGEPREVVGAAAKMRSNGNVRIAQSLGNNFSGRT